MKTINSLVITTLGALLLLATSCKEDKVVVPTLSTTVVTDITETTANSGGDITSDGGAPITARGVCWSTNQFPTISDNKTEDSIGVGKFSSTLSDLLPNTTYYVRAYATNSKGTGYGSAVSFTTQDISLPILSTTVVTDITETTAKSGGNITSDGGAAITARGVCWSTNQFPTISDNKTEDGTGTGEFYSALGNLLPNTTYYVRAYATNSKGTGYGDVIFFTTLPEESEGTFTDPRDNTVYKWVKIGNQVWMAENLRYLPNVVGLETGSDTEPYCYVYDYNGTDVSVAKATENYATYGVLYNWLAAMNGATSSDTNPSGVQGICPAGWHLPSDAEWTQLTDYLGGENVAGGKLKETGTIHWNSPNEGATNETGFTALPGGFRSSNGNFRFIGDAGILWSATELYDSSVWRRRMNYNYGYVNRNETSKKAGLSVRCLRD